MKAQELIKAITAGELNNTLKELYGAENVATQAMRYTKAINEFIKIYGDIDCNIFSVPGRSELSGNHTDHNHGEVLAGSINLDIIAIASKTDDGVIRIKSKGFDEDCIDTNTYTEPNEKDFFKSGALIAGMAKAFTNAGYNKGGYIAYTTSNVFKGPLPQTSQNLSSYCNYSLSINQQYYVHPLLYHQVSFLPHHLKSISVLLLALTAL